MKYSDHLLSFWHDTVSSKLPSYTNQAHLQSHSPSAQQLYTVIESQSIQKPAHIRIIVFCWKRCELKMFSYHTADVLCISADWHGKKHFQIQNVLRFKGTLWHECHDQMGNLMKCSAGVLGPFFSWRWMASIQWFHCFMPPTPAWMCGFGVSKKIYRTPKPKRTLPSDVMWQKHSELVLSTLTSCSKTHLNPSNP